MAATKEQIQAMLESILDEAAHVEKEAKARVAKLYARADVFREMLDEMRPKQAELEIDDGNPLRSYLRKVISDGKARALHELVEIVERKGGLLDTNVVPGRSVHMAMVNLKNQGFAKKENDRWIAANE